MSGLNILAETYFAYLLSETYKTLTALKGVTAIGFDSVRGSKSLDLTSGGFPLEKYLFAGVIDGRNIWANNLDAYLNTPRGFRGYSWRR